MKKSLARRTEAHHCAHAVTGILRLPTERESAYATAARLMGTKEHTAKARRYLLAGEYACLRQAFRGHPAMLAALDLDMEAVRHAPAEQAGDLAARLRRAAIEDAEQNLALAEFHAAPTETAEDKLLRESLEEIGALTLLVAELRARKRVRETLAEKQDPRHQRTLATGG